MDERGQYGAVGVGIRVQKLLEAVGLREHSIAPLLETRKARPIGVRAALPTGERRLQRFRVYVAHQLADELHLTPSCLASRDATRQRNRIRETPGKPAPSEPARVEPDAAIDEAL